VNTNEFPEGSFMSTQDPVRTRPGVTDGGRAAPLGGTSAPRQRRTTETKAAFKTTELMAYVATVVAVVIAGAVVDSSNAGALGARQVWLYVTILTVGYMISRGLAKAGSRDPYWDDDGSGRDGR
jgi:hypothetical protein